MKAKQPAITVKKLCIKSTVSLWELLTAIETGTDIYGQFVREFCKYMVEQEKQENANHPPSPPSARP